MELEFPTPTQHCQMTKTLNPRRYRSARSSLELGYGDSIIQQCVPNHVPLCLYIKAPVRLDTLLFGKALQSTLRRNGTFAYFNERFRCTSSASHDRSVHFTTYACLFCLQFYQGLLSESAMTFPTKYDDFRVSGTRLFGRRRMIYIVNGTRSNC